MIAAGTNLGLQLLLATRAADVNGTQTDLATFLRNLGGGADVFFTGHSLGGCLASVLAPSLAYQLGASNNFKVYTFAAPSAGNRDFAEYVDRLFSRDGVSSAFRVFNDLDIVPMSWATLLSIAAVYVPAPACTAQMQALIDWAQVRVAGDYQQPTSAVELHGQVQPTAVPPGTESRDNVAFFTEVDFQHGTETYMQLLAAPVMPTLMVKLRAALSRTAQGGGGGA
jgi:hypothetical protein